MRRTNRIEGGWDSQLTQVIRRIGFNKDVDVRIGTVKSPPPMLKINVDGMKLDLEADDIIIAEHVGVLRVGDRVIVLSANEGQLFYVIGKVA